MLFQAHAFLRKSGTDIFIGRKYFRGKLKKAKQPRNDGK